MTRVELEGQLENLRRDRGAATLAGKKFNHSAITAIETDLAALEDAEAERVRRDRGTAEAERQKRLSVLQLELAAEMEAYLANIKSAENHLRGYAADTDKALLRISEMGRLSFLISGKDTPIPIDPFEAERRFGCRHSAVMGTIHGREHRLGSLEWAPGHYKHDDNWYEREKDLLDRHVKPLTEKE